MELSPFLTPEVSKDVSSFVEGIEFMWGGGLWAEACSYKLTR